MFLLVRWQGLSRDPAFFVGPMDSRVLGYQEPRGDSL